MKSKQKRGSRKGKPNATGPSTTRHLRNGPPSERSFAITQTKINPDGSSKAIKFVYKLKP